MALSSDLISQFVKATQDKKEPVTETTAYGKIVVKADGKEYVQLDGSELLTPISTTTVVNDGDRVMVTIKNHTAIVTGDLTNPSASNKDVTEIGNKITEFEILIGDKVSTKQLEAEIARIEQLRTEELEATNAKIETLEGKVAKIDQIETDILDVSGKVTANEADITTLRADIADFKDVTADRVDAVEGNFNNLSSDYAQFEQTVTTKLEAAEADIKDLDTNKLDTETANAKYATIDFSNIGEAAIEKLFSDSGIIKDLIMSDGKVTGELVGVTIKGDIIEGNTVKADKLVILGEDGLYYKLNVDSLGEATASSDEKYQNGLDGSAILAESITAEKIAVDDLVAFGATIGGFHINEHAIYSGVKESMTNTTPGLHMTDDGQINIGDSNNFLKYYVDADGNYKLEIQADSLKFGSNGTTIEEYISNAKEPISKIVEGYPLTISDGVKVIDFEIDGKSEQYTNDTASTNICPPTTDSRWTLEGGAYVDSDGSIHLPDMSSKASIRVVWDQRSNKMNVIYTIATGGNSLLSTAYLDENKAMLSGNGAAFMDKPDGYTHTSYFGGENTYGDALGAAKYVVLTFQRSSQYTPNAYSLKDISISIGDSVYTPYNPVTPTPDDPSEIKSIGTYNEETGKYEIELVNRGKNYVDVLGNKPEGTTETINGVTYTVLEDGRIKVNGTATDKSVFYIAPDLNILLDSGIRTISGGSTNIGFQVAVNNNGTYVYPTCYGTHSSFTYTNPIIRAICLVVAAGKTVNNEIVYTQFEDGVEATEYESGFLSSTIIELNEPPRSLPNGVKDTARMNRRKIRVNRRVGSIILDGSDDETYAVGNIIEGSETVYFTIGSTSNIAVYDTSNIYNMYCNRFTSRKIWNVDNEGIAYEGTTTDKSFRFRINKSRLVSVDPAGIRAWLSENPMEIVYELAEPITEDAGEIDIPMYKNKTNIYYIGNDVEPDRLYCEYYTLYAERVADLDTDIDEVSASITIEAGKIVQEATDGIISRVTNIEKKQNGIDGELETLTSKVEAAITEDDVTILINKELEKGVDKVTTSTGFTFDEEGLHISKSTSLMETTIDDDGMTINRGDEDRLVANNEGVTAYNLHAKTYLVIGSSSRFEDYVKKTESGEEPRTGCFWVGDIGGIY